MKTEGKMRKPKVAVTLPTAHGATKHNRKEPYRQAVWVIMEKSQHMFNKFVQQARVFHRKTLINLT